MDDTADRHPAWLVEASLGRLEVTRGKADGEVTGLFAVSPDMPDALAPRLELDGALVDTSWDLPSPAVKRRHPEAANAATARFRARGLPARTGVLELLVQDSRTGERTPLITRHVVAPGPGSRAVERVLNRIEGLLPTDERDEASYRQLRRILRRVPAPARGVEWQEARVLVDALFHRAARATHRRLRALRDVRRAAGQQAAFDAFWTRVARATQPRVLGPHGYQVPLSARDEGEVWRETAHLIRQLDALGYPSFVSSGTLLGLVRDGRLISHDDDVDLAVVLAGDTITEAVDSWMTLKSRLASSGLLRLDFEEVLQAHCKLTAAGGLSVDLFPVWTADDRVYAWPVTCGGIPASDLLPLESREVAGVEVPTPRRPEVMLEQNYGTEWQRPDPAFRFDWAAAKMRFEPFLSELRRAHAAKA